MEKKPLFIVLGIMVLLLILVFFLSTKSVKTNSLSLAKNRIYYFYGSTCTHCKDLEAFLQKNEAYQKLKITKLEVFEDQNNGLLMGKAGQICKLNDNEGMGVPMIFFNNQCFIGTPEAESFFKGKLNNK